MNPPLPTALKLLKGNPGKRPLNNREAKPEHKIPPCPPHLEGEARKEWKRIGKLLLKVGLLTVVDRAALAAYCVCWARWIDAEQNLKKTGSVVKTKTGYPILNPYLSIANANLQQMRSFLSDFGMTPSSRSRIQASPPEAKPDSKLSKYLGGKKTA